MSGVARTVSRFLILALVVMCVAAQPSKSQMTAEEFEAQLGYQDSGEVTLSGGIATIELPESFRYIGPEGSQRLLVQGWGNPPETAAGVLGMLIPAEVSPVTPEGWGIVITYEEDGYVDDSDAANIDYTELLQQMQEATTAENEERAQQGFESIELVGWAEPPYYDAAAHKLYWAKELSFDNSPDHTLNYNIRILGRRGILVLNAVAGMAQLDDIRGEAQGILSAVDFNQGHRYADFISGDKVASYGVTALIAGGAGALAAKTGLLAKFWKVIVIGFLAVLGAIKKFFSSIFGGNKQAEGEGIAPQG